MNFNLRSMSKKEAQAAFKDTKTLDLNHTTVCVTGTISGMTRAQVFGELRTRYPHITFATTITRNVDYLITGFGCGQTKLSKAESYGIIIIESSKLFH